MSEPEPKPTRNYGGRALKFLADVRRHTATIEQGQAAYAKRIEAYQRCRAEGVLFSDIAEAAHCTDAAVMTALKKAEQAAS